MPGKRASACASSSILSIGKFLREFAVAGCIHGLEGRALLVEVELAAACRPIAMLLDQYLGDVRPVAVRIALVVAMNEDDDVRVLLDGARVAQVGEPRLAAALFDGTREL